MSARRSGPLAFDVGYWYYYYPGGNATAVARCSLRPIRPVTADLASLPNGNVAKSVASFYEVYGKVDYTWTDWAFGANFYYSPNFLNTGADGEYLSGTIKFTAPEKMALGPFGWYVSGEFGHQWLGTSDAFYGTFNGINSGNWPNGIPYADYNTWNVGLGFTWKVFTLDLRYYDTDLTKVDCNAFTSDPLRGAIGQRHADQYGWRWLQLVRRGLCCQAVGRPHARQPEVRAELTRSVPEGAAAVIGRRPFSFCGPSEFSLTRPARGSPPARRSDHLRG